MFIKHESPIIEYFKINPKQTEVGKRVKIKWKVKNEENIYLHPIGNVKDYGEKYFEIPDSLNEEKMVFRLSVTGKDGSKIKKTQTIEIAQVELKEEAILKDEKGKSVSDLQAYFTIGTIAIIALINLFIAIKNF